MNDLTSCNSTIRQWYVYAGSELVIYFGGLIFIVIWRVMKVAFCEIPPKTHNGVPLKGRNYIVKRRKELVRDQYKCFLEVRYLVSKIISTQYMSGKLIMLISTIAAIISVLLYLYEAFQVTLPMERCDPLMNPVYCADLFCNLEFLVYFLLRFVGTSDKISFWLSVYTIIDIFTIPQILISLILHREWFGLRFLRVIALMRIQIVLQSFNILTSAASNRITQLATLFLSILIGAAGFVHLLENSGDLRFPAIYVNQQSISYGDSLYFIIVTLSTVGYGDFYAKTVAGKIFICIFIILSLALFASFVPELAEFLFSRSFYSGWYKKESGCKHVVVCGNINYASVSTFLADFYHKDRSNNDVEVVFVNKNDPDSDLKSLLRTYFVQVKYFQGTVMDHADLDRVLMASADACLILANQTCTNPNDEDAANTMRVVSLKNYCSTVPVIIQLLHFENKVYLEKIPAWDYRMGDHIICYSEIELGILAQSCLVPGFSTFLTNLFAVRSHISWKGEVSCQEWLKNYLRGVSMEIYQTELSPSLENMPYLELVSFCFKELNLLLIALEITDPESELKTLYVNPVYCKRVPNNCSGYFICDSYDDAKIAKIYCSKCHSNMRDLRSIKQCKCQMKNSVLSLPADTKIETAEYQELQNSCEFENIREIVQNQEKSYFECHEQNISDCLIVSEKDAAKLNHHIILFIFSEKGAPLIGIKNFLLPLRKKTIKENHLKELLIVCEQDLLENEWMEICRFPKIKVVYLNLSVQRIIDLLAIERSSGCVLLNANGNSINMQNDLFMVDKEVIIANLFLLAESKVRIMKNKSEHLEKKHIKGREMVTTMAKPHETISIEVELHSKVKEVNVHIPMISKLAIESNVQFLDIKGNRNAQIPNYLKKPFACGSVFTSSMLDSLLSTAYFNRNALTIMELLITGGCLDEQVRGIGGEEQNGCDRIYIKLMPIVHFSKEINWKNNVFYRDLFIEALSNYSCVCLGLYRRLHTSAPPTVIENIDRYVITNPPANFLLHETDKVYCLHNSHSEKQQKVKETKN